VEKTLVFTQNRGKFHHCPDKKQGKGAYIPGFTNLLLFFVIKLFVRGLKLYNL